MTYYMEDTKDSIPGVKGNRHLLENSIAQPTGPIAVRGNVFSFLHPWSTFMRTLSDASAKHDFREWPLDQ
eukprot:3219541-Karenia_brevis.AAC.1